MKLARATEAERQASMLVALQCSHEADKSRAGQLIRENRVVFPAKYYSRSGKVVEEIEREKRKRAKMKWSCSEIIVFLDLYRFPWLVVWRWRRDSRATAIRIFYSVISNLFSNPSICIV